jgi:hypothetical protein
MTVRACPFKVTIIRGVNHADGSTTPLDPRKVLTSKGRTAMSRAIASASPGQVGAFCAEE